MPLPRGVLTTTMPRTVKLNAIILLGLALLFSWAFTFAKHDPALWTVIPFGQDPMMPSVRSGSL